MTLNPCRKALTVVIALALLAAAEPASAQASPDAKTRTLGQHRFPVGEFSPTPFTLTTFAMRVGVELYQVPSFAQLVSTSGDASHARVNLSSLLVAEALDFSVRLHDLVAISGAAYGRARVGANRATLLNAGVDYVYGGKLGATLKLLRVRQFQLALQGSFGLSTGQVADIGLLYRDLTKIADDAVSEQQRSMLTPEQALGRLRSAFSLATADLLTPFNTWSCTGALAIAQALNPYLGLQASLGFEAEGSNFSLAEYDTETNAIQRYQRSVQTLRPNATLALDLDGSPSRIPLDVMLEYELAPTWVNTSVLGSEVAQSSIQQLVALALYYSGRADLQLGITGYLVFGQTPLLGEDSQPSHSPREIAARFVFRYIW
jgi:hypothetical protein